MTDPSKLSPKHGSSTPTSDEKTGQASVSQADGTAANAPPGETQALPKLQSETPESREGRINPSAPSNVTSKMVSNTTRDSAGEVGEPSGEGTLDAPKTIEHPHPDKADEEDAA